MASDAPSPVRWFVWVLTITLVLVPVALPWLNGDFVSELDGDAILQYVGLSLSVFVLLWLVLQKRRKRGIDNTESRTEGSEDVFENFDDDQHTVRREPVGIRNEDERFAELDQRIQRRR